MIEKLVSASTLPEAYHKALSVIDLNGIETECTDYNTKQLEISMTIEVTNPLQEPMISKLIIGGFKELQQYKMEVLDGILDFEIEAGKWDYTYHSRIANQYDFIISELKRNPNSRRAVISIRDNEYDSKSQNPACLQHIQYFIRDNKLYCKVLFRSNDAVEATFFNMFALICLQEKIANELGIEVGCYTHRANSFHVYKKDYKLLHGYIEAIKNEFAQKKVGEIVGNITYDYKGFFQDLMEESIEQINNEVKVLKDRENEIKN